MVFCPLASRQIVAYRALIESDGELKCPMDDKPSPLTTRKDVVNIQARNRPCPCGSGKR